MLTVGIDPGLDGAIVALADGRPFFSAPAPVVSVPKGKGKRTVYDVRGMVETLRAIPGAAFAAGFGEYDRPDLVMIESTSARSQGRQACHSLGRSGGLWEGITAGMGWRYQLVAPATWYRPMTAGAPGKGRDKGRSVISAGRLIPGLDLRRSERARKPHDGIADAGLLALYAYRQEHTGPHASGSNTEGDG